MKIRVLCRSREKDTFSVVVSVFAFVDTNRGMFSLVRCVPGGEQDLSSLGLFMQEPIIVSSRFREVKSSLVKRGCNGPGHELTQFA